jgi:hypothetical protein
MPTAPRGPTRTSTGWRFKLLEPGGVLFTYSCSGGISADLFHKIVASAGGCRGGRLYPSAWAARPTTP